ncbi:MAG: pyruvate/oxaloacetate carboxyltransferase [Gammaproteobacteria bacterium]
MPRVHITETVLRDAHQSLIATRLRSEDMLPICPMLDKVGYWSIEMWGGATFDACLRFLKEDPWERLRKLRAALPNTRLQMLLRGQNLLGYRHYSDDVVRAFVERAAANGIDVFRIFDALNDPRNLRVAIEAVKAAGKHAQGAICYTTSPVHGIPQFMAMAKELESGCLFIDTALSPFSGGTSHPPTESMVAALKGTGYDTGLDLPLLQEIGMYFYEVRKKYRRFESEFTGVDTRVQVNQIPGGMISNLANQLREQGALDRMNDVLAEVPRVREDLGYPPLVTPTSQIVGTQAVLNVLTGSRYKSITNEVKYYLQGRYGRPPGPVNNIVRQQAIGNEDVIDCRPADLLKDEMHDLRDEIGELATSDEDVLSFAMFPEIARGFLEQRKAGTLVPEPLELPGEPATDKGAVPVEFNVTLHGETYHIKVTGSGHKNQNRRPFYVSVDGSPEEIMVETLEELISGENGREPMVQGSRRPKAQAPGHVTTSMPGTIVEVLVKVGDAVNEGDPLLITEAMKMETEIHAPIAGTVATVHVAKGDTVNPDEALIEIN